MQGPDPFFIVGNSRSGTTLVARVLKKHPVIHVLNETHFMEEFSRERKYLTPEDEHSLWRLVNRMLAIQRKDYYRKSKYEEYPEDARKIICQFHSQPKPDFAALNQAFFQFEANRYGKRWAGDQTPRHVFYISELLSMYPDARFIHMVRDPRAVLYSQKNKWKAGQRWGQPRFEVLRSFLNYHPITTALIWKKAVAAGSSAQSSLPKKVIKTIHYEHLVENPRQVIQELCKFLQIKFFPKMLNVGVELSGDVKDEHCQKISQSVAKRWTKGLTKTEVFLAEKLAGSQMKSLGYELTGFNPNFVRLICYALIWPFQVCIALMFNLGRMGNPITYISKRLFQKIATEFHPSHTK